MPCPAILQTTKQPCNHTSKYGRYCGSHRAQYFEAQARRRKRQLETEMAQMKAQLQCLDTRVDTQHAALQRVDEVVQVHTQEGLALKSKVTRLFNLVKSFVLKPPVLESRQPRLALKSQSWPDDRRYQYENKNKQARQALIARTRK